MKCPMRHWTGHDPDSGLCTDSDCDDCVKTDCAWWDTANECCVIQGIGAIAGVMDAMWQQDQEGRARGIGR